MRLDHAKLNLEKSLGYLEKAKAVIPGGLFGHFKFPVLMEEGAFPAFAEKGKGCHIWDIDGNKYIDYINGLGANLLGYAFDPVEDYIRENATSGDCLSLAKPNYLELAEDLVKTIHSAEWAVFAKNGADVTSMSVVASRAYTKKKKVVGIRNSYHGPHINWSWCTPGLGRHEDDYSNTLLCDWNDTEHLETLFEEYGHEIACIILTPVFQPVFADSVLPDSVFLQKVRQLCDEHNSILIFDDVRTGMRLSIHGSDIHFGTEADLICMSKALGNTYSVSCLLGKSKLSNAMSDIFFSGTFWGVDIPLLAARATLKYSQENQVISHLDSMGDLLKEGLENIANRFNIPIKISGPAGMPYLRFLDDKSGECDRALFFAKESCKRGALFHPFHNWCLTYSHQESHILETINIAEDAFSRLKGKFY